MGVDSVPSDVPPLEEVADSLLLRLLVVDECGGEKERTVTPTTTAMSIIVITAAVAVPREIADLPNFFELNCSISGLNN